MELERKYKRGTGRGSIKEGQGEKVQKRNGRGSITEGLGEKVSQRD